ncbi:hypothetical protein M5C92_03030 [Trueperella pyogenes]|uniref:hypothetical protein n=1 Tax=Trueperella pyogenes TaxID=1661 RepID=UPI00215C6A8C|nr:hypothetical protein [Trueperella pyogenes]UVJ60327.1 hypothetical protein M5C92_03030 [Trueperella pyogenes]
MTFLQKPLSDSPRKDYDLANKISQFCYYTQIGQIDGGGLSMSKYAYRTIAAACTGAGALLFSALVAQPAALAADDKDSPVLSGEVVVKYKDGTEAAEAIEQTQSPGQAHENLPTEEKERIKEAVEDEGAELTDAKAHADGAVTISLDKKLSESDIDSLVGKLQDNKDVEFVEPVYIAQPFQVNREEVDRGKYTSYQWSLRNGIGGINADEAWLFSKGKDVTVAVLDTGIVDHPEFTGKLLQGSPTASVAATATGATWIHATKAIGCTHTNAGTGLSKIALRHGTVPMSLELWAQPKTNKALMA